MAEIRETQDPVVRGFIAGAPGDAMTRRNEFLVGLSLLGATAAVVGGALWLSEADVGRTTRVQTARFRSIGRLQPGAPVLYRGVRVGNVAVLRLADDNWVEVDLRLDRRTTPSPKGTVRRVLGNKPAMLLIAGYSFHSWELLGMWAWTPAFLAACFSLAGAEDLKAAGLGSYVTAFFHFIGILASFSMGFLSDRWGRAVVLLGLSAISSFCSFLFGWTFGWPLAVILILGALYAFSSLVDSPVLSAALSEAADPAFLGATFGIRSLLGFGAGAVAPLAFGLILDGTNPGHIGQIYTQWGWAFSSLGFMGLGATAMAGLYKRGFRQAG